MTTFTVTNTLDAGAGSLRQAILNANALAGADTIDFSIVSGSTISLSSGFLYINDSLTINGLGADNLSISGDNMSSVFFINLAGDVAIDGLTITEGNGFFGGGIANFGSNLTLSNSVVSGNFAAVDGGGIYNTGTLTIIDSTISGNTSATYGGGISNTVIGTLTITDSIISGNSSSVAGGIDNVGTATITGSTVSGNSSDYGGGIGNFGTATITGSIVSGNSSDYGGGVFNVGTATITDSTLSGNSSIIYGGGVFNVGTATITGSTIAGNTAVSGAGGVFNNGTATITNSTISGNIATDTGSVGGGIFNLGALDLANSTFSDNAAAFGGGHFNYNGAFDFTNTIIANSVSGGDCISVGAIGTNLNNLVEDGGCNALLSGDPNLGPLQNNGGPTFTHALLPGSIAINAGDNAAIPMGITTDQRGPGFDRIIGGTVDIGAFESSAPPSVPEPSALAGVIVLGIAGITSWWRQRK